MSLPILIADRSSSRAGGTSVKDVDDEVVATIPIKVPLPTLPLSPEATTTPVAETTLVLSDVELLAAFVQRSDPAAFTQIVERYGPMVYRVAIRAVDDPHLADDVFQATFLVLAQSAHKIRSGEVLPAWLHGTARNIARRVFIHKATERRQLAQFAMQTLAEKGGEMTPSTELDPFDELVRLNEQQLLDEELQQLPEASRAPLVLFYLEGKSQAEIAQQMGLSVEAIEGRLRRAKQELRQRLIRRGVFLSTVVAAATVLTPSIACAAPASTLVSATLATALGTTAVGTSLLGGTAASTTLSAGATTAAQLAAQEVAAMSAASKATAIFLTTAASTTVATGLLFGAIAGSLCGVPGLAPALSNSPAAEMEYPLNLVREEGGSDPFALEVVEPVLLAQVELPVTVSDPDDTNESDGRFRMTRQYDVSDFDADLRKKFVDFYKLEKSVTFRDNMMQIRALEESHWLYEMALKNYREKRNQGKLNETEFEAALSELRRVFANAPDAAIQNLKAAEQVLTDRELTHGLMDAGTGDLRRRVDLWQAVVNAVQNSEQPRPLSDKSVLMSEPNPEANPVAYQVADLDIDHKWIALEYVRTLDVYVASHESTQSFVVRANEQIHKQINEFIENLRNAAYEQNIESVSRQLVQRLKTHSDNHPAVEQLRQLLAQLERVENEHRVLEAEAMNNDLFARHRKLSFYAGVTEERPAGEDTFNTHLDSETAQLLDNKVVTIDTPESSLRMVVRHSRKLTFPTKITTVDGFDNKLLTVTPLSVDTIQVVPEAVGETTMTVTCESGKKYRISVLVNTPMVHALHDELVRQKDAEILKWQQSYRDEQVDKELIRDELGRATKEWSDRVSRLNKIVDFQRLQLEELQVFDCFPEPDGKITTVDAANGTVWLDIGRKDHLRTQVTFSVYGKSTKGVGCDTKNVKAKIEVVEVRENSSIARIVEEDRARPIEVGDVIYSPAWSAGVTESFAIVGSYDLNGDGEMNAKDRQILKDLLDNAGAEIDLEITADGLREPADGKLTVQTKWLIVGDLDQNAVLEETRYKARKQKLNQALDRDIALAQRALSTSPVGAVILLEGIRAAIQSAPFDPDDKSNLLQRADAALSDAKKKLEVRKVPTPVENPHKEEAETIPQKLDPTAAEKAKLLKQLVDRVRELMDEAYHFHFLPNAIQGAGISIAEPHPLNSSTNTTELNSQTKVSTQHELLVQEARELGIRVVSLKDFLTYLGWKPENRVYLPGGVVPFPLNAGGRPPALNELAQAPAATEPLEAKPVSVAKTIPITNPETEVELPVHEIRLLKFPVPIAKAEVQYDPVLEVEPVRGQLDTLHLRAIMDGRCQLIVTGTNDAVYRVGITAGTPPKHRFREIDQNESKALNALQGQVSLEFPDNSLKEICEFIAQLHNVPVTLDTEDLKAAGADPDVHVSITAKGLSQAQALTAMLEKVKEPPLDYYIDGGAIHISTVAAMKERERLVYYRLASLSPEGQAAAEKYITPLATAVAPLEGDLLVDASVFTHKKFEEYLQGAWRLESQRPARAIPLFSKPVSMNSGQVQPTTEKPNPLVGEAAPPLKAQLHQVASPRSIIPRVRVVSEAERQVYDALALPADLEITDVPLKEFINDLANRVRVVSIDGNLMPGLSMEETTVSISAHGCSWHTLLNALALELDEDARFTVGSTLGLHRVNRLSHSYLTVAYDLSEAPKTPGELEAFVSLFVSPHPDRKFRLTRAENIVTVRTLAKGHCQIENFLLQAQEAQDHPASPRPLIRVTKRPAVLPAAEHLQWELQNQTSLNSPAGTLSELIEKIQSRHEIEIRPDRPALEAAGVKWTQQVNLVVSGIQLKSALRLLAQSIHHRAEFRNEGTHLLLTVSPEESQQPPMIEEPQGVTQSLATPAAPSVTAEQIETAFQEIIERKPTARELEAWLKTGNPDKYSLLEVRSHLLANNHVYNRADRDPTKYITLLYQIELKRSPTPEEAKPWILRATEAGFVRLPLIHDMLQDFANHAAQDKP